MVKYLFMPLHWLVGGIIRGVDLLTSPKPMQRSTEAQQQVDQACTAFTLYHYPSCPFCVKVRRQMKRLNLTIPYIDPRRDSQAMQALQQQGGKVQVPCLQIDNQDGTSQWLYESTDINDYLTERFSNT